MENKNSGHFGIREIFKESAILSKPKEFGDEDGVVTVVDKRLNKSVSVVVDYQDYLELKTIRDEWLKEHFENMLNKNIEFESESFEELDKYINEKAKDSTK